MSFCERSEQKLEKDYINMVTIDTAFDNYRLVLIRKNKN